MRPDSRRSRAPGVSGYLGRVRPWRQLGHQLQGLQLRAVHRAPQHGVEVIDRAVRGQPGDGVEVQSSVGQHGEQDRMATRGAGDGDAQVGLPLREVEAFPAVREHGRTRLAKVEPAAVDLGDVQDEVDLDPPRVGDHGRETAEQVIVRERVEQFAVGGEWSDSSLVMTRVSAQG